MARRADIFCQLRMDLTKLGDFVHGGGVDFFLSVEAGAHGPFVEKVEEGTGLDEAYGFGIREEIESDFKWDAAIEKAVLGGPGVVHGAIVEFFCAGILHEQSGSDVVGFARVGESEQRAGARDHAMALVLGVGGVADFFGESVIGVLESTHHGSVNADVQDLEAVGIASGIEKTVDGFGVGTLGFGQAEDGAVGIRDDARSVRRIIHKPGSLSGEPGVEFTGGCFATLKLSGCSSVNAT